VVFDYAAFGAPVAILAERRGQSGWLRVESLEVASVEAEQLLLLFAVDDDGAALDGEWCERLLDLPAQVGGQTHVLPDVEVLLDRGLDAARRKAVAETEARNSRWFDEEVEKLDLWADDMKVALERELKDLDVQIRTARKVSKEAVSLQQKLDAQRQIKALEGRRHEKRRQLFEAQDEIDGRRAGLIEDIERRLGTRDSRRVMFSVRWVLA
jgi:hypothetical protein